MSRWAVISGVCGVMGITLAIVDMQMLIFVHLLSDFAVRVFLIFLILPVILALVSMACGKLGSNEIKQTRGVSGYSLINVGLVTSSLTLVFSLLNVLCCLAQMNQ